MVLVVVAFGLIIPATVLTISGYTSQLPMFYSINSISRVFSVLPDWIMCFGDSDFCSSVYPFSGTIVTNKPVQFSNNFLLDPTTPGVLQLSRFDANISSAALYADIYNLPHEIIAYFFSDGGVVIGNDIQTTAPGSIVISGKTTNVVLNGMYQASRVFQMAGRVPGTAGPTIYTACLIINPTRCGLYMTIGTDDVGWFHAADQDYIGPIQAEVMDAKLQAAFLINRTMTTIQYTDFGSAIPCIPNPMAQLPPPVTGLWLSVINGTCAIANAITTSLIPTQTCTAVSALPLALANAMDVPPATFIIAAVITNSTNPQPRVAISMFADSACTQPAGLFQQYTTLGNCLANNPTGTTWFDWRVLALTGS